MPPACGLAQENPVGGAVTSAGETCWISEPTTNRYLGDLMTIPGTGACQLRHLVRQRVVDCHFYHEARVPLETRWATPCHFIHPLAIG